MKIKNVYLAILLASSMGFACNTAPKGDEAVITDEKKANQEIGEIYNVDTADSFIQFTGNGVGKNHVGKFKLTSGTVTVTNNTVIGGSFVIDINSIDLAEKGPAFQTKLRPHLLSADFFEVEKYGTAKFEITSVEAFDQGRGDTSLIKGANYMVSGNLTLKETTKNISFPAKIDLDNNSINTKASFDIDRTEWKMNYGNDKNLKDKFISEEVNIEFEIKAKR